VQFFYANLIWVDLEGRDIGRACLSISQHFWPKCVLLEAIKEYVKKDARD
jgi:hypothetical protein